MERRITAFIIALWFIAGIFPATGVPVAAAENTFNEIQLIVNLGIMSYENSTDFFENEPADREDTVRYVLNLMNVKEYTGSGVRRFADVSVHDVNYAMLDTAADLGIIRGSGNGEFRPKDKATLNEACVMIMRALGYGDLADAQGGAEGNYYTLANKNGLLKGVLAGAYVTRGALAKMFYNSFRIGLLERVTFGGDANYEVSEERTALSFFKLKMTEGVVTANDITSVYNTENAVAPGRVRIGDYEYLKGGTEADKYVGYYIEALYADEDTDYPILEYAYTKDNNITTVPLSEGEFYEKNGRLAHLNEDGKETTYNITPETFLILNGKAVAYDLNIIVNSAGTGRLTLVKHKNTGAAYAAAFIDSYLNDVSLGVDIENRYIFLKYGLWNHNPYIELPSEEDNGRITVIKNGEEISWTDIKSDEVVSYAVDESQKTVTIYVSDKKAEGIPEEYSLGNNAHVKIDGVAYGLAQDIHNQENINIRSKITAYLNFEDKVADVRAVAAKNYAFVVKAVMNNSNLDAIGQVKLITDSGAAQSYNLADRVTVSRVNDISGVDEVISTKEHVDVVGFLNATTDLITYSLNPDNEIDSLEFVKAPGAYEYEDQNRLVLAHDTGGTYHQYSGVTLAGYGALKSLVFLIPIPEAGKELDESECTASVGGLVRSTNYKDTKFYDVGADGTAGAILVRAGLSGYTTERTQVYITKKVVESFTSEGVLRKKIYYMAGGSESSIFIADNPIQVTSIGISSQIQAADLALGDVFTYESDSKGQLRQYSVLYRDSSDKNKTGVLISSGSGVGNNRELLMLQGFLRYKENGSLTVEYITSGRKSFELFTYSGNPPVVKINRERQTMIMTTLDSLIAANISSGAQGDKILVTGNRNVLGEIVVFE